MIPDPYFDSDPLKFNYNHLPLDDAWRLNSFGISKDEFRQFPIVHRGFFAEGFELSEEARRGTISIELDHPMKINFTARRKPKTAHVLTGKRQFEGQVKENKDGTYTFYFLFPKKGNYFTNIYFDGVPTLTYLVQVKG